ncbi:MAG: hypothetical protein AB8G05_21780 [Oligoflexales bacterium]
MLKIAISASFILGSFGTFNSQLNGEEFAYNGAPKTQFFLLNPNGKTQKRFYYLIKDKDQYSATKQRLTDLKDLEIHRFGHLKNNLLQAPLSGK